MPDYHALKTELQKPEYGGTTDAQAADLLNEPGAGSPVPGPITVTGLMSLIGPASLAKLYPRPALAAFRDDVVRQDRGAAANWITLAFVAGDVTEAEKNAVLAYLSATVPGPPRASAVFGAAVSEHDIAHARSL